MCSGSSLTCSQNVYHSLRIGVVESLDADGDPKILFETGPDKDQLKGPYESKKFELAVCHVQELHR